MTDNIHHVEGFREGDFIIYHCDLCGYEVKVSTGKPKKTFSNDIAYNSDIKHVSVFKEREGIMSVLSEFINIEFGEVTIGKKLSPMNPVVQLPINYN